MILYNSYDTTVSTQINCSPCTECLMRLLTYAHTVMLRAGYIIITQKRALVGIGMGYKYDGGTTPCNDINVGDGNNTHHRKIIRK